MFKKLLENLSIVDNSLMKTLTNGYASIMESYEGHFLERDVSENSIFVIYVITGAELLELIEENSAFITVAKKLSEENPAYIDDDVLDWSDEEFLQSIIPDGEYQFEIEFKIDPDYNAFKNDIDEVEIEFNSYNISDIVSIGNDVSSVFEFDLNTVPSFKTMITNVLQNDDQIAKLLADKIQYSLTHQDRRYQE